MIINDPKIDVRNKVKEILKHFEDPSEMQIMESFISSPLNRRDDLSVNQSESECK